MQIPLPVRVGAAGAFLLLLAALFVGGAQPGAGQLFDPPWDKLAHFALFSVLAGLLLVGTAFRYPVLAFAVAAIVGATDEFAQARLPGRHADLLDFLTDIAAAAIAVTLLTYAWRRLSRRAQTAS